LAIISVKLLSNRLSSQMRRTRRVPSVPWSTLLRNWRSLLGIKDRSLGRSLGRCWTDTREELKWQSLRKIRQIFQASAFGYDFTFIIDASRYECRWMFAAFQKITPTTEGLIIETKDP
jgi:hypothetical protein